MLPPLFFPILERESGRRYVFYDISLTWLLVDITYQEKKDHGEEDIEEDIRRRSITGILMDILMIYICARSFLLSILVLLLVVLAEKEEEEKDMIH